MIKINNIRTANLPMAMYPPQFHSAIERFARNPLRTFADIKHEKNSTKISIQNVGQKISLTTDDIPPDKIVWIYAAIAPCLLVGGFEFENDKFQKAYFEHFTANDYPETVLSPFSGYPSLNFAGWSERSSIEKLAASAKGLQGGFKKRGFPYELKWARTGLPYFYNPDNGFIVSDIGGVVDAVLSPNRFVMFGICRTTYMMCSIQKDHNILNEVIGLNIFLPNIGMINVTGEYLGK